MAWHSEPTDLIAVFMCSDGVATFYLRPPPDVGIQPGLQLFDYRSQTLNRVCQSLHLNRFQVVVPPLGAPWNAPFPMVADEEKIPELSLPWFDDAVRQAAAQREITSLPGMSITPVMHVEDGILVSLTPGRMKLWSPLIELPKVGLKRLFLWSHADIWWQPESLTLDTEAAHDCAIQDAVAIETLLGFNPRLDPSVAQRDAAVTASDLLDQYCAELLTLLDDVNTTEETLHQWLASDRHRVFLDPHATRVWSKLSFGATVSDFVVRRSDGSYVLIEIERASVRILQAGNQEPTASFNHACQQVRDWRRYVRDNTQTVRHELGLIDIYEPMGRVIIGRDEHIVTPQGKLRWRDLQQSGDLSLATYDDLVGQVRALATSLRTALHGAAS